MAFLFCVAALFLTNAFKKQKEDPFASHIQCIYDELFQLIRRLREEDTGAYQKVAKRLDNMVNLLVEVESELQNTETNK